MNRILTAILFLCTLSAIVLQIHNASVIPKNRGFDAGAHEQYVQYLRAHKRVPLPNEGWELYQPPLYYALRAGLYPALSAQVLGVVSYFALIAISFLFFKTRYKTMFLTLLGTVIVATTPVVLYMSPTNSNEFFATVLISVALVLYVHANNTKRNLYVVGTGIALGFAMLAKSTAFVFVLAIAIDQLAMCIHHKKRALGNLITISLSVSAIAGWYYLRNIVYFHNPFVTSVDFSAFKFTQPPGHLSVGSFLNPMGFLTLDLFRAHYYSLWAGVYYSWFFDGQNVIVPIQNFSKIGVILVLLSVPITLSAMWGIFLNVRRNNPTRIFLIYAGLLITSFILYNFKLPFYSTVKASFILSLVIPFAFYVMSGISHITRRKHIPLYITIFILMYTACVIKTFWIYSFWYK